MNYKTYAAAKIANPDSEIVTTGKKWDYEKETIGTFEVRVFDEDDGAHIIGNNAWITCNPADHCSSLKEFLESGFKLVDGDVFIGVNGNVITTRDGCQSSIINPLDGERYILSAASLNGGCKIPAKAEQWTIYHNTLPLCELTDEQYGKMRRMHDAGMDVEWRESSISRWELLSNPTWNAYGFYRIKQKSERELFIDKSVELMTSETERTMEQMFGAQFDSGARYTDLTQHFGENI